MRVVHVHRMRGIGGSERHLLTLLPALAERGIEPAFIAGFKNKIDVQCGDLFYFADKIADSSY